jgi:hypothetical protein
MALNPDRQDQMSMTDYRAMLPVPAARPGPRLGARSAKKGMITMRRAIPTTYPAWLATKEARNADKAPTPLMMPLAPSAAVTAETTMATRQKAASLRRNALARPSANDRPTNVITISTPDNGVAIVANDAEGKLMSGKIPPFNSIISLEVIASGHRSCSRRLP